jgi:hypothetical protein
VDIKAKRLVMLYLQITQNFLYLWHPSPGFLTRDILYIEFYILNLPIFWFKLQSITSHNHVLPVPLLRFLGRRREFSVQQQ